jgi:hypothetical protein
MARLLGLFSVALVASASMACASRNSSSTLAQDGSGGEEAQQVEADSESFGTSFVGGSGGSLSVASFDEGGSLHLESGGTTTSNPGFFFQPAGCLTVTKDPASSTNTYTFADCTGPLGLVHLNGTVTVKYTLAANQLTLQFSASNFEINRATISSWQANAVITANGAAREMTWSAQLSGTTGGGRQFSRTNNKDIKWTVGEACIAISGQSQGNISGHDLQTTITDYQRCADSCPEAGSEITIKNLDNGDSIDIKYSGGPEATLTLNGKSESIGLACGL